MIPEESELIKVAFSGPVKSGKSSIIQEKVMDPYMMTIGVDFKINKQTIDGRFYKLQLWDFGGSQKFRSIVNTQYRIGQCVVFVYDASDKESFHQCEKMFDSALKSNLFNQNAKGILLASKTDLERQVSPQEGMNLANKIGGYMEISILSNPSAIRELFQLIVKRQKDKESHTMYQLNSVEASEFKTEQQPVKYAKNQEEDAGPAAPDNQPHQQMKKMSENKPKIAKVMLVGSDGCGKTSMLMRFVDNKFPQAYLSTIGVDFRVKEIFSNGEVYKLQIWDTAGQQRFKAITKSYYKGVCIVFLVYDCQNIQSFEKVSKLSKQIEENTNLQCSKWLVANKSGENNEKITTEEGMSMAKEIGYEFMEVSAKMGDNLNELFERATDHAMKNGYI